MNAVNAIARISRKRGLISVDAEKTEPGSKPASVTVVVPNFNYARFLPGAVDSVLGQAGVVVDVVIVDDASTDDSVEVAERIVANDGRVRVVRHTTNRGAVATFNDGLEHVSGEFLVRLDADDQLTPGALARAVALARAYPEVGLIYGHPVHFAETTDSEARRVRGWARPYRVPRGTLPPARENAERWLIWSGRRWLADRCRAGVNVITAPEVVMRTSVVERVGGQRDLAHTHDMEMWLRIAAHADVGYIMGADQAYHRDHPTSLSKRADPIMILQERRAAFDVLFSGAAGRLPEAPALHARAKRALARDALQRACHAYDRGNTATISVPDLTAFATEIDAGSRQTMLWHALRLRQGLGPSVSRYFPPFQVGLVARRIQAKRIADRWERRGV